MKHISGDCSFGTRSWAAKTNIHGGAAINLAFIAIDVVKGLTRSWRKTLQ